MTKSTNIPWIPTLAKSWSVQRAKTLLYREKKLNTDRRESQILSLTLRGVVENDPENPEGLVPADYATYQLFEEKDLVFKLIDLENVRTSRVGLVPKRGIMSSAYLRLRPRPGVCVEYLYWTFFDLYNRQVFNQLGNGVRSTLGAEDVLNLPIALPDLDTQVGIADYLDTETARIDALIEKKKSMTALLVEHEHSMIRSLVSGGPELSLIENTSSQGGETQSPPGWRTAPLYSICTFENGKAHENFVSEDGKFVCVNSRFVSTEGRVSKRCDQNLSPARKNDILMVMSDLPNGRALAKAFFVESDDQFAVNQRVCIIRPGDIEPKYAFYQLDRNPYFLAFDDGSNQTHLSSSCFTSFKMLVPPQEQQLRIVKTLDAITATRRKITTDISSQIEKLSEFRQALITAAVTGELEVPGVAA